MTKFLTLLCVTDIVSRYEKVVSGATRQAKDVKRALESIKKEDNEWTQKNGSNSAKAQMRDNLYQSHARKFQSAMDDFQKGVERFKTDMRERTKVEIKMIDASLSDEQVENIVDSGQAQQVMKQMIVSDNLQVCCIFWLVQI